jgi:hypothetical protein
MPGSRVPNDKDTVCYEQNAEQVPVPELDHVAVPIIAMTLTGGLWFGAASVGRMPGFQYMLLLLAAIANIGLIFVLTRVRYVIDRYLEAMKSFHPAGFVNASGRWINASRSVAWTFRILLFISAVISFGAMRIVHDVSIAVPETRRVIEVIGLAK